MKATQATKQRRAYSKRSVRMHPKLCDVFDEFCGRAGLNKELVIAALVHHFLVDRGMSSADLMISFDRYLSWEREPGDVKAKAPNLTPISVAEAELLVERLSALMKK